MTTLAIIGTAGRWNTLPMTADLWRAMACDAMSRVTPTTHVVSGGAAWADHLAVGLFLNGKVRELTLHLPAPFVGGRYQGPDKSSGAAANFYHGKFSRAIGQDTLRQIECAIDLGAKFTTQPAAEGYSGFFARNKLVARAERMLAYTFASGDAPRDGGTFHTWSLHVGPKTHVSLLSL